MGPVKVYCQHFVICNKYVIACGIELDAAKKICDLAGKLPVLRVIKMKYGKRFFEERTLDRKERLRFLMHS